MREGDDAERALGRAVAIGLPVAGVASAVIVGLRASMGPALLVLAAVTLLGTISLLWASVRTLSGDAPLPVDMEASAVQRVGTNALAERKRRVLRALKDLEAEHAIGKIDDADYEAVVARYRDEAKEVMRQMDVEVEPLRGEAERIAQKYLEARGLADSSSPSEANEAAQDAGRVACAGCGTSNESDAAFCKRCGAALTKTAADHAVG
ncbi:MAG TPA: zinc ribbon domain-containing protein [Polyangiaceae bacterium]|nr:zinc ribbon domain-containing protein [Polyangiaceae bacterium]